MEFGTTFLWDRKPEKYSKQKQNLVIDKKIQVCLGGFREFLALKTIV